MNLRDTIRSAQHRGRAAFTLTEMLVATALVVLIMMMFAQMYGTAIGTMTEQRAMANNDQKARVLTTVLRGDLQNMTYRQPAFPYGDVQGIVPLAPGDEQIIDPDNQRGYFYYSENNPNDDTDDVLQFTAMVRIGQRGDALRRSQQLPYFGRAGSVPNAGANQPNRDDGNAGNNRGESRAAEIAYFVRGGNLYRRVLLLRDPLTRSSPRWEAQPGRSGQESRIPVFGPTNPSVRSYGPGFWREFDYAATRVFDNPMVENMGLSYFWLHSVDSLSNNQGTYNNPIALPWNRFGHLNDPRDFITNSTGMPPSDGNPNGFASPPPPDPSWMPWPDNPHHGSPREYADATDPQTFIGRFTQQESSSTNLNWPGLIDGNGQAFGTFDRSVPLQFDAAENSLTFFEDGIRIAEDILLTNVEAFDVKILDTHPDIQDFVDLGYSSSTGTGHFRSGTNQNQGYGPRQGQNRVFDTWHPDAYVLPLEQDPDPSNNSWLPRRRSPRRPLMVTGGDVWTPGGRPEPGTVLFPLAGMFSPEEALPGERTNRSFAYRCIRSGERGLDGQGSDVGLRDFDGDNQFNTLGTTGQRQPEWPLVPGQIVVENGDEPLNTVIWQCFDNRIGLRAVRVAVRYRDLQSNLPRQVTIVHSFVE